MERRNLERHDRLWVVDAEEMRWTCRFSKPGLRRASRPSEPFTKACQD